MTVPTRRHIVTSALVLIPLTFVPAVAIETAGNRSGEPRVHRYLVGMTVRAQGGDCQQIVSTIPVPGDWPEQQVSIVDEDFSHHVQNVQYGKSPNGTEFMQISIPYLPNGDMAKALVTYEITRHPPTRPDSPATLHKPKNVPRNVRPFLGASPLIEVRNGTIRRWSKTIEWTDDSAWTSVEAVHDAVREKVTFQQGKLKGAARTLKQGHGNHEDITSLFIAICRIHGIPARTVWVPDQCYAEFYLHDDQDQGQWYPCQLTGEAKFGTIRHLGPVLQKGDNFKVSGRRKAVRFVPETLSGAGQGQPQVNFVRQLMGSPAVQ